MSADECDFDVDTYHRRRQATSTPCFDCRGLLASKRGYTGSGSAIAMIDADDLSSLGSALHHVIEISQDALREGCERAHDLFLLNRLRPPEEAAAGFDAVYDALGVDGEMRHQLEAALLELIPVRGLPVIEAASASSMLAGVLVGLLIADSTLPAQELDLPITFD